MPSCFLELFSSSWWPCHSCCCQSRSHHHFFLLLPLLLMSQPLSICLGYGSIASSHCCHHKCPLSCSMPLPFIHPHSDLSAVADQADDLSYSPSVVGDTSESPSLMLSHWSITLLLWLCSCTVTAAMSSCTLLPLYICN